MQQKVSEIATIREYAQDTETQLMSLKESLDWKIIAVQQMSVAVDKCKVFQQSSACRFCSPHSHLVAAFPVKMSLTFSVLRQRCVATQANRVIVHLSLPGCDSAFVPRR